MTGTYMRSEVRRKFRDPRYVIFALAMPLILFGTSARPSPTTT